MKKYNEANQPQPTANRTPIDRWSSILKNIIFDGYKNMINFFPKIADDDDVDSSENTRPRARFGCERIQVSFSVFRQQTSPNIFALPKPFLAVFDHNVNKDTLEIYFLIGGGQYAFFNRTMKELLL